MSESAETVEKTETGAAAADDDDDDSFAAFFTTPLPSSTAPPSATSPRPIAPSDRDECDCVDCADCIAAEEGAGSVDCLCRPTVRCLNSCLSCAASTADIEW